MATLLLADHDNQSIKDTTARALSAAVALGAPVTVLVLGIMHAPLPMPQRLLPVLQKLFSLMMRFMPINLLNRWPH